MTLRDPNALPAIARVRRLRWDLAPGLEAMGLWFTVLPGNDAPQAWDGLFASRQEHGYWPLVVADPSPGRNPQETLEDIVRLAPRPPDMSACGATIAAATDMPFPTWLAKERDPAAKERHFLGLAARIESVGQSQMAALYRNFAAESGAQPPWEFRPGDFTWPDNPPTGRCWPNLHCLREFGQALGAFQIKPETALVLVPTLQGHEVPAFTQFGHFNSCPPTHVHVAMLEWLEEKLGGVLVSLSSDAIELRLGRHPSDRSEALHLACDLRLYAEEAEHGDWKTEQLAAFLMTTELIHFWWD